jgi:hypothetical protein
MRARALWGVDSMNVHISKGLGSDGQYYVSLDRVVIVVSRVALFKLGLAFYHVAMGNRRLDDAGGLIQVDDLRVVVLGGSCHRISSETSVSSNHQELAQNPTLSRVGRLLFESSPGGLLLRLLERGLGLAVVEADWLGEQLAGPASR